MAFLLFRRKNVSQKTRTPAPADVEPPAPGEPEELELETEWVELLEADDRARLEEAGYGYGV
jgi:hypothetical protein